MNTRNISFALLLAAMLLAPTTALMAQVEGPVASELSNDCVDCNHAYNERFCSFCSSSLYLDEYGLCEHGFCVKHHSVQRSPYYPVSFGLSFGMGWVWNHHNHCWAPPTHHCGHGGGHHGCHDSHIGIGCSDNNYSFWSTSSGEHNHHGASPRGNDIIIKNPKPLKPLKPRYPRLKKPAKVPTKKRLIPQRTRNKTLVPRKRTPQIKRFTPSRKSSAPRKSFTPSRKSSAPRKSFAPSRKSSAPRKSFRSSARSAKSSRSMSFGRSSSRSRSRR